MTTETKRTKILTAIENGMTVKEASKKFGYAIGTIYSWKPTTTAKTTTRTRTVRTPRVIRTTTTPTNDLTTLVVSLRDQNTRLRLALSDLYLKTTA